MITDDRTPDDEDEETGPASPRRLAGVLGLVAATLVWAAAISAYLRTGQVKVVLVVIGIVCAMVPIALRSSEGAPPVDPPPPPPPGGS